MRLIDKALQTVQLEKPQVGWSVSPQRLTCVIVEPRYHPNLRGALYNMANVYANSEVGIMIYHSTANLELINEITSGWEGVQLFCLEENNLTKCEYSHLLTTASFYEPIRSTHLLIFQTDSYIFKTIPDEYFQYDYVGARWKQKWGNGCGNGGFSLRRKDAMVHAILRGKHKRHPEDIFFAHVEGLKLPSKNLQEAFSVELINHTDPVGCHVFMRRHLHSKIMREESR